MSRGVCLSFGSCIDLVRVSGKSPYDEAAARDIYILKRVSFPRRPSIDRILPLPPPLFLGGQFSRSRQLFAFFRAREARGSMRDAGADARAGAGAGGVRSLERAYRSKISSDWQGTRAALDAPATNATRRPNDGSLLGLAGGAPRALYASRTI